MSQETTNVETLKGLYAKWRSGKEGGYQCWMDMLAADVEWRSVTDGATGMEFTSCKTCHDDVRAYFEGLKKDWEMVDYTADEFISQDNRVVMRGSCSWRHRHTGKVVTSPKVDFFQMADGKIAKFYEIFDTAAALAATVPDKA